MGWRDGNFLGGGVKKTPFLGLGVSQRLGGGELGHGLGALGHRVLGELTGEHQTHGGLDLTG
eukprot:8980995-Pyramimonas_sp.AAC.1